MPTHSFIEAQTLTSVDSDLRFGTSGVERARFGPDGSLLVGVTEGSRHRLTKLGGETQIVLEIGTPTQINSLFFAVAGAVGSSARSGMTSRADSATGRSINAGGTINASGADYAEYMTKAEGCGPIGKGDVCGVNRDGHLTRTWADAVSFVIHATAPSYVGGDTWAADMAPRPEAPGAEPVRPVAPVFPEPLGVLPPQPVRADGEADDAFGDRLLTWMAAADAYAGRLAAHQAYSEAAAAYPDEVAAYETAHAQWTGAVAQYEAELPAWEAELEARRVRVDRIAFAGQVPVNIDGPFAVGDYLIAAPNGGGIRAVAVAEAEITFDQYRRRLGRVWAIRDGRPWVDVQHG